MIPKNTEVNYAFWSPTMRQRPYFSSYIFLSNVAASIDRTSHLELIFTFLVSIPSKRNVVKNTQRTDLTRKRVVGASNNRTTWSAQVNIKPLLQPVIIPFILVARR
jgi:hypothetical protein